MCRSSAAPARAVVSPAASTLRDEMAVSGQRLLAASGQIPMAAHTGTTRAILVVPVGAFAACGCCSARCGETVAVGRRRSVRQN